MVLFKDLAKASNDLITKDFPHDKSWDIEAKHKSPTSKAVFTNTASAAKNNSVKAQTVMKYTGKEGNTEVKVAGDGASSVELNYIPRRYVDGVTLGTKIERKPQTKQAALCDSVDITCEYDSKRRLHAKIQANPLSASFITSASVTCNKPNHVIAAAEISGTKDVTALKYGLGCSYTQTMKEAKWLVSLRSLGSMEKGMENMICNVHASSNSVGGTSPSELSCELKHTLNGFSTSIDGKPINNGVDIKFAGLWYLDTSKTTSLKAKLESDAQAAIAISHTFSPTLTGILGIQSNVTNVGAPDSMKYGIKLYCTA